MSGIIQISNTKSAISKLLAEKKKKLADYYAYERDNSYFDISEEDAKSIMAEKNALKKEVRTLEYYLVDVDNIKKEFAEKIVKIDRLNLAEKLQLQDFKKAHNEELMANMLFLKEQMYCSMMQYNSDENQVKSFIIEFINAVTRQSYIS